MFLRFIRRHDHHPLVQVYPVLGVHMGLLLVVGSHSKNASRWEDDMAVAWVKVYLTFHTLGMNHGLLHHGHGRPVKVYIWSKLLVVKLWPEEPLVHL